MGAFGTIAIVVIPFVIIFSDGRFKPVVRFSDILGNLGQIGKF
jgi:hypothetical protein